MFGTPPPASECWLWGLQLGAVLHWSLIPENIGWWGGGPWEWVSKLRSMSTFWLSQFLSLLCSLFCFPRKLLYWKVLTVLLIQTGQAGPPNWLRISCSLPPLPASFTPHRAAICNDPGVVQPHRTRWWQFRLVFPHRPQFPPELNYLTRLGRLERLSEIVLMRELSLAWGIFH